MRKPLFIAPIILLFSFLSPIKVKAQDCSIEDLRAGRTNAAFCPWGSSRDPQDEPVQRDSPMQQDNTPFPLPHDENVDVCASSYLQRNDFWIAHHPIINSEKEKNLRTLPESKQAISSSGRISYYVPHISWFAEKIEETSNSDNIARIY